VVPATAEIGEASISINLSLSAALAVSGDAYIVSNTVVLLGAAGMSFGGNLSFSIDCDSYTGSITFNQGAGDFTFASGIAFRLPAVVVNNAGVTSFALTGGLNCKAFTLTAGKFSDGGNDVDVAGSIIITAGTPTTTGAWTQSATGNVYWPDSTNPCSHLSLASAAGIVSTITNPCYVKKVTLGAGSVLQTGTRTLQLRNPTAANFFVQDAANVLTITGLQFFVGSDLTVASNVNASGVTNGLTIINSGVANILTLSGTLNLGAKKLAVYGAAAVRQTVTLSGNLTAGAVQLGHTTAGYLTTLNLGAGRHKIASLAMGAADEAAGAIVLNFGTSVVELSGTLEGASGTGVITALNTSAVVVGGTINNLDLTGQTALIHIGAPGTGNTNVIEMAPPTIAED
jgi:hypothetical protein